MSETNDDVQDGTGIESIDVNEDEPAKVRIHGSDEGVEFDIGSSIREDEILYLKFTDLEKLQQLRDFAETHLEEIRWSEVDDA